MTLDELNALPGDAAERALLDVCGSRRWAVALAARRPFKNHEDLDDETLGI